MRKLSIIVMSILLSAGLFACSDSNTHPSRQAMEMYIKVLQSDVGFYYRGGHRNPKEAEYVTFSEYLANMVYEEYTFAVTHFTLTRIDGSDIPAVVLEISPPIPGERLFLHYYIGNVYGYYAGFRSAKAIYTDGTFSWSGGIANVGIDKLHFSSGSIEYMRICERSDIIHDDGSWEYVYFIHGEQVSEDVWNACYYEREEMFWHVFAGDTIAEDFASAWDAALLS